MLWEHVPSLYSVKRYRVWHSGGARSSSVFSSARAGKDRDFSPSITAQYLKHSHFPRGPLLTVCLVCRVRRCPTRPTSTPYFRWMWKWFVYRQKKGITIKWSLKCPSCVSIECGNVCGASVLNFSQIEGSVLRTSSIFFFSLGEACSGEACCNFLCVNHAIVCFSAICFSFCF